MLGEVTCRPVRLPADHDFLLSLYASTRIDEFSILGWPEAQVDALMRMQFEAQTRHYDTFYPGATHTLVVVDDTFAGRLIVERSDGQIRIVDIALLPEFRHRGVGGRLVRAVIEEADADGLPIRCHAVAGEDAQRFWEHLGLVARGMDGMHVEMERQCATSQR
jgi:GNAT superfamily N-acetyltransferase